MKRVGIFLPCLLAVLSGCTETLPQRPPSAGSDTRAVANAGLYPSARLSALPASTVPASTVQETPFAVITLGREGEAPLSAEMQARLAEIARLAIDDEQIFLRLEGHVPDEGSPAWNVGIAGRSLQQVKARLESMRVPSRRIRIAAFGAERTQEAGRDAHRVEVYLVRPRR